MLEPRDILEALPVGVVAYDRRLVCTYANAVALELLGDDAQGRPLTALVDVAAQVFGEVTPRVVVARSSRGGVLELRVQPAADGGTVLFEPATDLIPADQEHERLLVTLKSIGDGVIVCDADGRITLMNTIAEEQTGWTLAQARGRRVGEVYVIQDELTAMFADDPVPAVLARRASTGVHDHSLLVSRTGQRYPVAHSAAPVSLPDGTLIGAVLVYRDMRSRRQLEAQIIRSAKLEATGHLAGQIAHDFNNVLAAIVGSTSMALRSTRPGDRLHGFLTVIDQACERARELTSELVTHAEGGAPVLEPISLAGPIRRAVSVALKDGPCTAEITLPDDLAQVSADPGQLRQAFFNLMVNANESMADGGTIEVHARNVELPAGVSLPIPPGRYVEVRVVDHGPGIPEENRSRIFEPFYTTRSDATGLGLATTHSIVHAHHGFIGIESTTGKGTTFVVVLPAAEIVVPTAEFRTAEPVHRRVLVMDDEPLVRTMLEVMLDELGYDVRLTADGDEALKVYIDHLSRGERFDLVILDLTVPGGKGGAETMKELITLDPVVIAIVSSGYSSDPVMAHYRQHGFAAVLPKPFTFGDLRRKLIDVTGSDVAS